MARIRQIFSTRKLSTKQVDLVLLFYRLLISFAMIRIHGLKKVLEFQSTVAHIPDPFGIGGELSALVAITANVLCAIFVAFGLLTRLSALFIASLTLSGLFLVHFQDPWPIKDVPYMYSVSFLLLFFFGPGKYSLDFSIERKLFTIAS